MRDTEENREKKVAARNPARVLPPGFHAAIFLLAVFFHVKHEKTELKRDYSLSLTRKNDCQITSVISFLA